MGSFETSGRIARLACRFAGTAATDLRFSDQAAAPASFAQCGYTPAVTDAYDPAIRHICVNPKGALATGSPAPGFTIQFRARIR
ncbi:MAG: hypothetical protein Q8R44_15715 [Novosphingobium sp.]|nr:hypothetical protein [Novosphingobium sp.]